MNTHRYIQGYIILLLTAAMCASSFAQAGQPGWQRKEVNWKTPNGTRIKAVNYPADKPLPTLAQREPTAVSKKVLEPKTSLLLSQDSQQSPASIIANVIDSPPVDGFVPWIAVSITDERNYPYELDAVDTTTVTGNYLTSTPESDYAVGIFDTGASSSLISDDDAFKTGMYDAGLVTSSTIELSGVTGSAFAWASQPLGLFIDGLNAIEPNGLLLDDSNMVGETNISIIVGDPVESPNVPTAIGAPLAVFFAAAFQNDREITITHDNNEFSAPDIRFYSPYDSDIPSYSNKINLELRPSDVMLVQYFPCIEGLFECPDGDGSPLLSTIIVNALWTGQGLFFVSSVDLAHGSKTALDKDGFMFDTGAQITVISEAMAARLQLNPALPDFTAEIVGVTGDVIIAPGFYIDSLEIVATPEWLTFSNVPVVMLDVASPEGGYLDGVIGMNLFVDLNFVFHGGGLTLLGQDLPYVEFEPISYQIIADIAPEGGDGVVNFLDLAAFADAWLTTPVSPDWNPKADIAPQPTPDEIVDLYDFGVFAEYWRQAFTP